MVSPGAFARPSVCLRCQLRQALLQARINRRQIQPRQSFANQQSNAFSTRARRNQEADEDLLIKREKPYYWKKVKTPDRVIGRPGRRQRVVSERLSTNSLEKPANVIVFKDVAEEPEVHSLHAGTDTIIGNEPRPKALTAKEIEDAITGRYIAPAETEVNLSIEALRPDVTVVEEKEFEEHKQKLMNAYTFSQLSRYLTWSFQASTKGKALREQSSIGDEVQELGNTRWHAGQTPLQQRHSHVTKQAGPYTKRKLVEQVLRLVWHLTIRSEEQEVGELEVKLQPWQISMLFDIMHNDRPYYQSFIPSRMLFEKTQVHLWRPDGTMRVTGRRQDAEEVARQLKLALLRVERLELDFKPFSKMLNRGSKQQKQQLFSAEELSYVSSLTRTVITEEGDGVLAIYGMGEAARYNARRLLLALLDLPTMTSFDATSKTTTRAISSEQAETMSPVDLSSGLHRRYRKMDLLRQVEPCRRDDLVPSTTAKVDTSSISDFNTNGPSADNIDTTSERLANELANIPLPKHASAKSKKQGDSYWHPNLVFTDWKVEFGRILHQTASASTAPENRQTKAPLSPDTKGLASPRSILQHQVPGLQAVLSFFERGDATRPRFAWNAKAKMRVMGSSNDNPYYLVAHLVPSPSGWKSPPKLPRLQVRFKFLSPQPNAPQELLPTKIMVIIDEQQMSLPLAEYATDLRLSRRLTLSAGLHAAGKDEDIREFITKLRESARRQDGLLVAPPELKVRLPQWLLEKGVKKTTSEQVEVKYLFERFEQVQQTHFSPRQKILEKEVDEDVKAVVRSMPKNMILDYREVEGGSIYGSRTMLGLRTVRDPLTPPHDQTVRPAQEEDSSVPEGQQSPTLDEDTAAVSKLPASKSAEESGEESQARTTHHGGEHGQAATSDVQHVERNAESSQDPNAKTKELVATALRFARLLTRATSGSLKHYGSHK